MPLPTLTPITRTSLRASLTSALGASAFWSQAELNLYITEALRMWQSAAAYWRARGTFQTTANTSIYDLTSKIPDVMGYNVSDRDVVTQMEYHLLEPPTPTAWSGSSMFALTDLVQAIERRRNQFLMETGVFLTYYQPNVDSPPIGRVQLQNNVISIRRVAWKDLSGQYTLLWREDEQNFNSYLPGWNINPDTPAAYSTIVSPLWQVQLAPVPANPGLLDVILVAAGANLDPISGNGVLLGVPDDFAWVVKWGALADLLSREGPAHDALRADYCEKRYREGVELAKIYSPVINAEINGQSVQPMSVFDLDEGNPGWQNNATTPTAIGVAGANIVALANVPSGVTGVTLDVLKNAPVSTEVLNIGNEIAGVIVGYAKHLAVFKCGGQEFSDTFVDHERLMRLASVYNGQLQANAVNFDVLSSVSKREEEQRPRQKETQSK